MSDCNCNTTLVKFPKSIACTSQDNYQNATNVVRYLGKKQKSFTSIKVNFFIESFENAQLFSMFYTQDIDYGREPFLIDLPIYGKLLEKERIIDDDGNTEVKKGWLVKFKTPLNWGEIKGITGTMSYELEVLDSLDELSQIECPNC
jgi:hypothetical protein